jgi:hypothetical protein
MEGTYFALELDLLFVVVWSVPFGKAGLASAFRHQLASPQSRY